jgi:UDP-N-acetylmuramyl pentapeptide phosphotransferase/UDP-N-acetylglucosamine-1-phosphate transferase
MIQISIETFRLSQIFVYMALTFLIAILFTPLFTDFLYKNRIGKKIRSTDYAGAKTPIISNLHKDKENTPTMGGL